MSRSRTSNLTDSCFSFSVGVGGVIVDLEVPQLKSICSKNKNIRVQNCSENTHNNNVFKNVFGSISLFSNMKLRPRTYL